ncbi:restriction endonuclease subunit S [Pseudobutyrivibrio xylanivorans]|uniref:Restriction endonuclease subunit S n=1 Tax=Pseudobutyrivibrio xylanivorans TaxID=185007 RepID=A0A5P6VUK2_PSEXY|nr:restriction endonuclease subunit S [Pseudobutyrivibrio xylanivorans]QFJ56155.1 restriction endonuclease subunit S [Pseudobutyrivibrio xylanivorans]
MYDNLYKQVCSIYDYWFTQYDYPNEERKPYKASGGKLIYSESLGKSIPATWNTTTVGEITTCLDSERIPLSANERLSMQGAYPYYGATEIMDYVNKYIFDGDYILLAEDGSVMDKNGHPVLQRIHGKCWINNHAHVLKPASGYSCLLLQMILKDIPVVKIKTGSIQYKINQENMNSFVLPEIPSSLREKFISITEPLDIKMLAIRSEIDQLNKLRDWLLPIFMNGQASISE